jgi:DNA-binding response OmpR family regulator
VRVLVVDDEPQILRALKVVLRDAGFEAVAAENASEALDIASLRPPQAAIVDLVLPDQDGVELTRRLREWSEIPILVLSAIGEEEEKVRALEAGADDYVTKPFSVRELVLRVHAVIKRGGAKGAEPLLRSGPLELDLNAHRFYVDGGEVELTVLEFKLLKHLMSEPGRVQTRERLLSDVWGIQSPLETRTVDTHVMRLREKLGSGRDRVETVRGVGYRLHEAK